MRATSYSLRLLSASIAISGEAGYRTIFTPYAELYHYESTSRGREEVNEEKLRRWKREQALFMQRLPEFFLDGDPWPGPNLSTESEYFSL